MLGWLLLGAILGAAVITICVSFLNKNVAQDKLRERNIKKGVIRDIVNSGSVTHINLDTIDESGCEKQITFEVNDYDASQIRKGVTIVA